MSAWGRGGIHQRETNCDGPLNLGKPQELGHQVLWKQRGLGRGIYKRQIDLHVPASTPPAGDRKFIFQKN